ncbi:hypothetical protein POM88_012155 [Heracleum sosnowskyi]|uniref:DUF3615 domain-containing protein n=1 Tax=Heracleum sosnowskyi TaxID=360622 RepID=A0AAD8IVX2_9APIA|nr:hypothetical protein POM88_012155 [Heracleum sosnowskyi]
MEDITFVCLNGEIKVRKEVALESLVIRHAIEGGETHVQVSFHNDIMSKVMAFCEMKVDGAKETNLDKTKGEKVEGKFVVIELQIDSLLKMTTRGFEGGLRRKIDHNQWELKNLKDIKEAIAKMIRKSVGMKWPDNHLVHLNFLAKPKNSDAPLDLFFTEVVECGVRANEVNKCWILKPRPSPSPVAMTCDAVYIWHPLDDEEDYMN